MSTRALIIAAAFAALVGWGVTRAIQAGDRPPEASAGQGPEASSDRPGAPDRRPPAGGPAAALPSAPNGSSAAPTPSAAADPRPTADGDSAKPASRRRSIFASRSQPRRAGRATNRAAWGGAAEPEPTVNAERDTPFDQLGAVPTSDVKRSIQAFIDRLPPDRKMPAYITFEELLPAEGAEILQIPPDTQVVELFSYPLSMTTGLEIAMGLSPNEDAIGVTYITKSGKRVSDYLPLLP